MSINALCTWHRVSILSHSVRHIPGHVVSLSAALSCYGCAELHMSCSGQVSAALAVQAVTHVSVVFGHVRSCSVMLGLRMRSPRADSTRIDRRIFLKVVFPIGLSVYSGNLENVVRTHCFCQRMVKHLDK